MFRNHREGVKWSKIVGKLTSRQSLYVLPVLGKLISNSNISTAKRQDKRGFIPADIHQARQTKFPNKNAGKRIDIQSPEIYLFNKDLILIMPPATRSG